MTDDRYDFCPLQMINLWWSSWKNMWGWIGAECGWREDLFEYNQTEHRYEWQSAESEYPTSQKEWWKRQYGWGK